MASSRSGQDRIAFSRLEGFIDTTGNGKIGMNAAPAQDVDDFLTKFAQIDCFDGQAGIGLDQANHIADGRVGIKTQEQVRTGQLKEMHAVALDDLAHVHQFTQQAKPGAGAGSP